MSGQQRRRPAPRTMSTIHAHAAGLDVGSTFHVVAVPRECADESVRAFRRFTDDLQRLADWLRDVGVTTVAMESTGVYWIPVFELLVLRRASGGMSTGSRAAQLDARRRLAMRFQSEQTGR